MGQDEDFSSVDPEDLSNLDHSNLSAVVDNGDLSTDLDSTMSSDTTTGIYPSEIPPIPIRETVVQTTDARVSVPTMGPQVMGPQVQVMDNISHRGPTLGTQQAMSTLGAQQAMSSLGAQQAMSTPIAQHAMSAPAMDTKVQTREPRVYSRRIDKSSMTAEEIEKQQELRRQKQREKKRIQRAKKREQVRRMQEAAKESENHRTPWAAGETPREVNAFKLGGLQLSQLHGY